VDLAFRIFSFFNYFFSFNLAKSVIQDFLEGGEGGRVCLRASLEFVALILTASYFSLAIAFIFIA